LWIGAEIGAQKGLGLKPPLRVADQDPAQGHGGQTRAVPERRLGNYLDGALTFAVPVGDRDGPPDSGGVFGHCAKVRQAPALEPRSAQLMRFSERSWFVEGGIQA